MPLPRRNFWILVLAPLGAIAGHCAAAPVDFDREIRPLFADQCLSCHGPDKHKGGLRLDHRKAALEGGTSGPAIVAGRGEESLLVKRLRGEGDEETMPLKKPALPAEQIALVSRWIDEGANWPESGPTVEIARHWSFVPPVRPAEPAVRNTRWVRNSIDRFVLARLEEQNLSPSPEASRETLLRRVSLDLTGLPPTPAEIDAFLSDSSPDAYEKIVERLLASPHYGERWARHWLDGARYADSNGYSIDAPRSIWPYRDWVVNALNRDMPFDQFAIEQLAGDLLPNATAEQRIATGFHRNTQINEEGGIDPEQFRVEAVIDRVGTTGTVFLGMTIACAQCHNHKFDPISQRDYYRLFAFFNSCDEPKLQVAPGITTLVMQERKEPRKSYVLIKGDFTRHGEEVTPGVPSVLPPLPVEKPTRLDLARWIVNPANPLTARVQVNRLWMHYFGHGLVETDNDFGTQGSPPTNPELLDWLATELVRQHWSLKAIHRLIVTSATYRQSSHVSAELAERDPYNTLLARQLRIRLDAEVVRDVELAASGLLCDKLGGPPVFPPQPEGVLNLGQVKRSWKTSTGPDRYRRGLYTWVWRMTPHPLLTSFDAPDATLTCTRRNRSNTPLQALTLLNDAAFAEFAQAFAQRTLKEGPADDGGRIEYAFRLCTSRRPQAREVQVLETVLARQRSVLAHSPDARAISGKATPQGMSDETFAPWVIVARVLLNLDETITRE